MGWRGKVAAGAQLGGCPIVWEETMAAAQGGCGDGDLRTGPGVFGVMGCGCGHLSLTKGALR